MEKKLVVGVDGMSCQGCVKNLTSVLQAIDGVSLAKVTLEPPQAEIDYDADKVSPPTFKAAIEEAGFDVICPGKDCH